jgi:tRNA(Ile)-lysidine synthase TilS/MesJ
LNIRLRKKVLQGIQNKDENKKVGNMSHRGQKVHGEEFRRWQSGKMGTDRDAQPQHPHGENICERCGDIQYTKICKRCVMAFIIILLRMPVMTYGNKNIVQE